MVTSHAVPVPNTSTSTLTPVSNTTVSIRAAGSTVRSRCGHMLIPGARDSATMVATGSSITADNTATNTVHAGDTCWRSRHAAMRTTDADIAAVILAIIATTVRARVQHRG